MSNTMSAATGAFQQTDDYDWDSDGGLRKGPVGVNITRADSDVVVKKPSWFGKETVFRPYPYLSDSHDINSPFEPYRVIDSNGRNKFSNWVRRYICAWNIGNPNTTFLIKRPPGSGSFDQSSTPLGILYRSINNAVKRGQAHPDWPPLLIKASGKSAQLDGPKECYLMQGALFRHDGKDYFGNFGDPLGFGSNPPVVLICSGGAGTELVGKLNEENDNYRGDPLNFEARYKHGDPVDCNTGRFFTFFEKGRSPYQNRYASQPTDGNDSAGWGSSTGGQKRSREFGYDVLITTEFENLPAKFNKNAERVVRSKLRPWDEALYFPTEIEQAHMLFRCFPPSACMYAFESVNKDWIPEDAYKKLANATSVPVHGYNPAQQQYAQPPGFGQTQQMTTATTPWSQPVVQQTAPQPIIRSWTPPLQKNAAADTTVPQDVVEAVDANFGFASPDEDPPESEAPPARNEPPKSQLKTADIMQKLNKTKKA